MNKSVNKVDGMVTNTVLVDQDFGTAIFDFFSGYPVIAKLIEILIDIFKYQKWRAFCCPQLRRSRRRVNNELWWSASTKLSYPRYFVKLLYHRRDHSRQPSSLWLLHYCIWHFGILRLADIACVRILNPNLEGEWQKKKRKIEKTCFFPDRS